eukprot:4771815-Amphidinium_carterae.1
MASEKGHDGDFSGSKGRNRGKSGRGRGKFEFAALPMDAMAETGVLGSAFRSDRGKGLCRFCVSSQCLKGDACTFAHDSAIVPGMNQWIPDKLNLTRTLPLGP